MWVTPVSAGSRRACAGAPVRVVAARRQQRCHPPHLRPHDPALTVSRCRTRGAAGSGLGCCCQAGCHAGPAGPDGGAAGAGPVPAQRHGGARHGQQWRGGAALSSRTLLIHACLFQRFFAVGCCWGSPPLSQVIRVFTPGWPPLVELPLDKQGAQFPKRALQVRRESRGGARCEHTVASLITVSIVEKAMVAMGGRGVGGRGPQAGRQRAVSLPHHDQYEMPPWEKASISLGH